MDFQVVKFSLQPLVENCFVHAYGQMIQIFKIKISAIIHSESTYAILVEDTGDRNS